MKFACALAILLTLSAPVLSQQDPGLPPVFRTAVNVVQVHAYVTDAQGNPVTGLTAEDFEVREDGKAQSIAYFAPINIPIEELREDAPAAATLIEPDVQSNEVREGRLYVIAVDDLRPDSGLRARAFLRRFVEQYLGENDVAAVILVGHGRRVDTQEFTSNRRLLLRSIDTISGWPGMSSPAGAGFSLGPGHARDLMAALQDLVEFLAHIPSRRKAVLLLSEDIGVNVQAALDTPSSASLPSIAGDMGREVVRTALRANVTIYPIDPNRLSLADVVSGELESAPDIDADLMRRESEMARRENLRTLGDVTGGFALVSSNNIEGTFTRIVRENSAYYLLGYYSTQDTADGKFRRLQVRVKRPGLQVHTINGYLAPKKRQVAPVRKPGIVEALSSPLAVSGLPMRVVAAPYRGEAKEAIVPTAIELDGSALEFDKKGDAFTAQLDVGYVISGATSITKPVNVRMDLTLRPENYEKARKNGIRILLEPRMKPGIYQLRVAVAQAGRRSGSVVHDVEVPDFARKRLTLGAISLTSLETANLHFSSGKNLMTQAMPGPLGAIRDFSSSDRVAAYTEVYENVGSANPHTVTVRAEVRTENGVPVRTVSTERSSALMNRRQDGYGFLFEIPLTGIAAGAYVLHVDATANVGNRPTDSRDVPIRIR